MAPPTKVWLQASVSFRLPLQLQVCLFVSIATTSNTRLSRRPKLPTRLHHTRKAIDTQMLALSGSRGGGPVKTLPSVFYLTQHISSPPYSFLRWRDRSTTRRFRNSSEPARLEFAHPRPVTCAAANDFTLNDLNLMVSINPFFTRVYFTRTSVSLTGSAHGQISLKGSKEGDTIRSRRELHTAWHNRALIRF